VAFIVIAVPVGACAGILVWASAHSAANTGAAQPIERPKAPAGEGL
jgi:hypothetical protein